MPQRIIAVFFIFLGCLFFAQCQAPVNVTYVNQTKQTLKIKIFGSSDRLLQTLQIKPGKKKTKEIPPYARRLVVFNQKSQQVYQAKFTRTLLKKKLKANQFDVIAILSDHPLGLRMTIEISKEETLKTFGVAWL